MHDAGDFKVFDMPVLEGSIGVLTLGIGKIEPISSRFGCADDQHDYAFQMHRLCSWKHALMRYE